MNPNCPNEDDLDLNKLLDYCADASDIGDVIDANIEFQDVPQCSDLSTANQNSSFTQYNSSNLYNDASNVGEITYNLMEHTFRPPTVAATHFNYTYPSIEAQLESPYSRSKDSQKPISTQQSYIYTNTDQINTESSTLPPGAYNLSTNVISNPGCVYPKMWYPNAPFGAHKSYGSYTYKSEGSHGHIVDVYHLSNSGREARNRAEKNRRDKLNSSIQELSTMVPHVAESPRRVDKTAVLRFAAHGLRLNYVFGRSYHDEPMQTTDALMKLLNSFFLTLTCNGQIVLVSSSVEQHLGHCQIDLYGQNIINMTHPEDHKMLKEVLIPTDLDSLLDVQPEDGKCGEYKQRTQAEEDEIDRRLRKDKRSFTIRLARAGPKSEPTVYELVKIDGCFRRSDMSLRGVKASSYPATLQLMRRSRGREDLMPLHTISANDIVLTAIAYIVRPPTVDRAVSTNKMEYKTRHLIDGRIIDCDQYISLVAGYMTNEVRNLSPFSFIHQDDVRWVIVALRQMYDLHSSYGESTYRLFSRNGKIIYLHTKGFLDINKDTNEVDSFVCVNTLLDDEEGERRIELMKNKFSVIIDEKMSTFLNDVPASENSQQLEKAVMSLVKTLKSESSDDHDYGNDIGDDKEIDLGTFPSTSTLSRKLQCKYSPSHNPPNEHYGYTSRKVGYSTKTPSIALASPATESIKSSVTKTLNAVNTTPAKYEGDSCNSNLPDEFGSMVSSRTVDSDVYFPESNQELYRFYTTSSGAVKRNISHSISKTDNDEYSVPMQRQAIENVLSNSLQEINSRLNEQLNTAMEIRDQSQRYDVPDTDERLADIMKEHKKQQQIYKNISNEFEVQRKSS